MLKTNIYKSKLIVIQHFASLELELSESNTYFMDRLYLVNIDNLSDVSDENYEFDILNCFLNSIGLMFISFLNELEKLVIELKPMS
jgi:hypothetical protein